MLDFQQKRKVRAVLYNRITIGALFVIVLFVLHSTLGVYQKERESEEMKRMSLARVEDLRVREGELQSRIERLGTNPGIEEEIRSKFSVAKDKENMVVIVEEQSKVSTTSLERSFWQKIWNFLSK